ncbi:HalOD1 output domain-containing protein [Haladaptatus sp. CMAA 1911]|uniref:HalOD1 output domain-containing protein n=1 Tax=unclassified Haladaptatus TaxID=2622732 RepID=UPI0037548579
MVPNTTHAPSDEPQRYVTYYDRNSAARLSTVIAHSLAELMDTDTDVGEKILYESVDPESLDHLYKKRFDGTPRNKGYLTIITNGYTIKAHADGLIEITPNHSRNPL